MPLETHLTTLETSGLLRLAQLEPELEYIFRHALVQEATYESILKSDRLILHRTVAETLERLYPEHLDSLAFLLGQHWREAGEREWARQYFTQAGEFAWKAYANQEAIVAYTQALALTTDKVQRFDLLTVRVAAYDVLALQEKQREDVDEIVNIAENLNENGLRCEALLALADYLIATNPIHAPEVAGKAREIARKIDNPLLEGRALYREGLGHYTLHNFSQSQKLLEGALGLLRQFYDSKEIVECYSTLAVALMQMWELTTARTAAHEAVQLSRRLGDLRQQAISLRRLAMIYEDEDLYQEALPLAEDSLNAYRKLGDLNGECFALIGLGTIEIRLLNWQLAEWNFMQAIRIAEKNNLNNVFEAAAQALIYSCLLPQGNYESGLAFINDLLTTTISERNLLLRAEMLGMKTWVLMLLGQYAEALSSLDARKAIMKNLAGVHQVSSEARLRAELGQFDQAREILKADMKAAEASGNPGQIHGVPLFAGYVAWLQDDHEFLRATINRLENTVRAMENNPSVLFYAFTMLARLHLKLGNVELALQFSLQSMTNLATVASFRAREEDYFIHSRALRANGHGAEADEYLQKAYDRVMLVASKTKDETLRQSWLENVRDNREIIAEWSARHPNP